MDELRWFRVREHMERLQAEAASDRLQRSGRPDKRYRLKAAQRSTAAPAAPSKGAAAATGAAAPARTAGRDLRAPGWAKRPCPEGDPC